LRNQKKHCQTEKAYSLRISAYPSYTDSPTDFWEPDTDTRYIVFFKTPYIAPILLASLIIITILVFLCICAFGFCFWVRRSEREKILGDKNMVKENARCINNINDIYDAFKMQEGREKQYSGGKFSLRKKSKSYIELNKTPFFIARTSVHHSR